MNETLINEREVSMNETLMNVLKQNRDEKVGRRGRGKKISSEMVANEEMLQEEQQPSPSRQYNNLAESSKKQR